MSLERREFLKQSIILTSGALLKTETLNYADIERSETQLRNLIRNGQAKTEIGYFFDNQGQEIKKVIGYEDIIPYTEVGGFGTDKIFTHLHLQKVHGGEPGALALSIEDILNAQYHDFSEIRAVSINLETGKDTISILKRGNRSFWAEFDPVEFKNKRLLAFRTKVLTSTKGSIYQKAQNAWNQTIYEYVREVNEGYRYAPGIGPSYLGDVGL